MTDTGLNSARVAWMRAQGAVQASWNDAGELTSVTLGPPPPLAATHVPRNSSMTHEDDIAERRRIALSAGPSVRRTGL